MMLVSALGGRQSRPRGPANALIRKIARAEPAASNPGAASARRLVKETDMDTPPIQGIVESCVYVDDLPAARSFYEGMLGLRLLAADEAMCVFAAGTCQNLQVCRRGWCEDDMPGPGGVIPVRLTSNEKWRLASNDSAAGDC